MGTGKWKLFTVVASGKEYIAHNVQKKESLASSNYFERSPDIIFFHLLLFQIVESFTGVKEVWKLGYSGLGKGCLHRQSLRRRKQVANINIRAISCVVWVEQWLGLAL